MLTRTLLAILVGASVGHRAAAAADAPAGPLNFKVGDYSLTLTNVRVVTGAPDAEMRNPADPRPINPDDLLAPAAGVWVTFDYETDFQPGTAPEQSSFLAVGMEIPPGKPWGYGGADIHSGKGKAAVRLHVNIIGDVTKANRVDEQIKLVAYTRTNAGENKSETSAAAIPVRFIKDGTVVLSTTQFNEIQAAIKRLGELEGRVKALEQSPGLRSRLNR